MLGFSEKKSVRRVRGGFLNQNFFFLPFLLSAWRERRLPQSIPKPLAQVMAFSSLSLSFSLLPYSGSSSTLKQVCDVGNLPTRERRRSKKKIRMLHLVLLTHRSLQGQLHSRSRSWSQSQWSLFQWVYSQGSNIKTISTNAVSTSKSDHERLVYASCCFQYIISLFTAILK